MGHSPGHWEISRGQLWCSWKSVYFLIQLPPLPLQCPFFECRHHAWSYAVKKIRARVNQSQNSPSLLFMWRKKKVSPVYPSHRSQDLFFLEPKAAVFFPSSISKISQYLPFSDKFPSAFVDGFEKRVHFFGGLLSCMPVMSPRDWHLGTEWLLRNQSKFMLSELASGRNTGKSSSLGL